MLPLLAAFNPLTLVCHHFPGLGSKKQAIPDSRIIHQLRHFRKQELAAECQAHAARYRRLDGVRNGWKAVISSLCVHNASNWEVLLSRP